ncbi:MAG: hypothetical protein A2Z13_08440 [Deltaproteobacteria bacterium RBG_16_64_85]|nr:MAG: hypothetical protein A2Z13_08440 [Deltaproteobacteria bacterium RBG_16_64_85]
MAPMILTCTACSAQNFVSDERKAVAEIPACCWKCGEPLPRADETGSGTVESNKGARKSNSSGSMENA